MTTFYDKLIKTTFEEEYKDEIKHPEDLLKIIPNGNLQGLRMKYVEHREKVDMERVSTPDSSNNNNQSQSSLNFKISWIIFGTCLVILGFFYLLSSSLEDFWSKIQAPFVWYFTERYPIFVENLKNATQQVLTGTIQNIIEEQMLNIFPRN